MSISKPSLPSGSAIKYSISFSLRSSETNPLDRLDNSNSYPTERLYENDFDVVLPERSAAHQVAGGSGVKNAGACNNDKAM